ncbi:hypothetical protein HK096_009132, partial [Nowakowskiella sp. JEL0078]
MAEGLLRFASESLASPSKTIVSLSAGTEATVVRPLAIRAMNEIGIDITNQYSKTLTQFLTEEIDIVITVCDSANDTCPVFTKAKSVCTGVFQILQKQQARKSSNC